MPLALKSRQNQKVYVITWRGCRRCLVRMASWLRDRFLTFWRFCKVRKHCAKRIVWDGIDKIGPGWCESQFDGLRHLNWLLPYDFAACLFTPYIVTSLGAAIIRHEVLNYQVKPYFSLKLRISERQIICRAYGVKTTNVEIALPRSRSWLRYKYSNQSCLKSVIIQIVEMVVYFVKINTNDVKSLHWTR